MHESWVDIGGVRFTPSSKLRAGTINDFSLAYSQATSAFTHVAEREMNNLAALVAYFRAERLHYFGAPPPPPATHRAESVGMSVKSRPI